MFKNIIAHSSIILSTSCKSDNVGFLLTLSSKYFIISKMTFISSVNYLEMWFVISDSNFYRLLLLIPTFVVLLSEYTVYMISVLSAR
jgi:hypothetical protein